MNLTSLPPVAPPLKDAYRSLIEETDRAAARLVSRLRPHLRCAPGCSSCCRSFSVSPIEAALIGEHLELSSTAPPPAAAVDRCGLLVNDLCSIYARRPLICRTQGLPIGYVDKGNEQIEVSVCPLNFLQPYQFSHGDLLFLDPFNRRLAVLNARYCRETAIDVNSRISLGHRQPLRKSGR